MLHRLPIRRQVTYLSGGEKPIAAVARALVRNPQLILADEPTVSLVHHSSAAVKAARAHPAQSASCAVVAATHECRLFDIAERLRRLADGRIVESARAPRLRGAPRGEPMLSRKA